MKNATKLFLLMAPLLGLFTASCGDNFDDDPKGKGPFCVYAGVRYQPGDNWKAKDGCNDCHCGWEKVQVLCSMEKICGDGGTSDVSRPDATTDRLVSSEALTPMSDAKAQDVAPLDVPISDADLVDAASDGPVSDSRLASERD